jgi:hypothetical protein
MCFASWHNFTEEFAATFCPENEATTALMRLESDWYYQCKWNVEAYIDEFKDLIDLSGYTDPIAIILKFRRGLNSTTQDRKTSVLERLILFCVSKTSILLTSINIDIASRIVGCW